MTSFKYIPPVTEFFTIKSVIYPKKDSSLIAPGMYAKMQILFYAQTMDNFEDEIIIMTEKIAFKVPLRAIRDKPAIILKNPLDCGKCLVGDKIERHFMCKNNGGDAHFKFYLEGTENQDNKNIQGIAQEELIGALQNNSVSNELLVIPPFTIFPQEFYLYKGMSQNISITFCPIEEGVVEKKLILACDTTKLQYLLRGEQIKVDIIIKTLDGLDMSKSDVKLLPEEEEKNKNKLQEEKKTYIDDETEEEIKFEKIDLSNKILEKEEKLENLIFEDTYPFASKQRTLVLKNISSLPIRYHWSIYDFYHQNEFKMIGEENFFTITPEEGVFKANEEITFIISFKPINSIIYEQKLELFIEDIPFQAIKQFDKKLNENMKTTVSKVEPYLPGFNSSLPSYPLYSFNLRGRGKLPFLSVNKNIIDLGNVYLGQKVEDNFVVSCEQSGFVKFKMTKFFQQILKEKKEENYVDEFYKNPCLEDDILIKGLSHIKFSNENEFLSLLNLAKKNLDNYIENNLNKNSKKESSSQILTLKLLKSNTNECFSKINFVLYKAYEILDIEELQENQNAFYNIYTKDNYNFFKGVQNKINSRLSYIIKYLKDTLIKGNNLFIIILPCEFQYLQLIHDLLNDIKMRKLIVENILLNDDENELSIDQLGEIYRFENVSELNMDGNDIKEDNSFQSFSKNNSLMTNINSIFTENKTKKILYSSYFDNKLTEGKKKRKEINYERLRKIDEKINVIKLFDMLDNILL